MGEKIPPPPKGFSGRCVRRGIDENYEGVIYQYATSSDRSQGLSEPRIQPRAVIFPTDDEDVFRAIKYAKDNKVGIAVRTGGHSYCGSSSTNGYNIQLDLSRTYTDFDWDDTVNFTQVTLGISITLSRLQSKLRAKGRFIPTGQCSYVNLGGHLHTGGYGQQARAFGLLADYVQKVQIITAVDNKPRWVCRDVEGDKRLFRAILGGSPGNYGVVTHVTLNVLKDEDHPKSRGLRGVFRYSEATLKNILDVMVKQDDTEDTAGDYDLIVSLVSRRDEEEDRPATAIVIFAQWANLGGGGQSYSSTFFDEILAAGGGPDYFGDFHGLRLLGDEHVNMSDLCSHWVFSMVREYQLPYYKRLYLSNSNGAHLKDKKWTTWVASRVEELEKSNENGLHIAGQFQYVGGKHSQMRRKAADNLTSLSWRDSHFGCTLDVFYDYPGTRAQRAELRANPTSMASIIALEGVRRLAEQWALKNDKEGVTDGIFTTQDRRLMWGSHDHDLVAAKAFYFETEAQYKELSDLKVEMDPHSVFTANRFSVGPHPDRLKESNQKVTLQQCLAAREEFDGHHVVRAHITNQEQLDTLIANERVLKLDYFTHDKLIGGPIDFHIMPTAFKDFQRLGLNHTIRIENIQVLLDQEAHDSKASQTTKNMLKRSLEAAEREQPANVTLKWFESYHPYERHMDWLSLQIVSHSDVARGFTVGKSHEVREQAGIIIGSGPNNVVFHGLQHAREWITGSVVEFLIEQLLAGDDERVSGYLGKYTFHIIPIMNPDGFVISQTMHRLHRKNAQRFKDWIGVDINRNWGFHWNEGGGSDDPCENDYRGPSAFSTPEARNVGKYLRETPNVVCYIDFHAYSQLLLTPYAFLGTPSANYVTYLKPLAQSAATAMEKVNGLKFKAGDAGSRVYQVSGVSIDYAYSVGVGAPLVAELRDEGQYGFLLPGDQIRASGWRHGPLWLISWIRDDIVDVKA
ncbi:hypothetical protein BGZ67_003792 [Mortierella alpina]|nr:hypothetical protein BGZ67_003792 [Mortierella alpina]